jgi:hypothetical protein
MRKTVRLFSEQGPQQRLAQAIGSLPVSVQQALADVADRTDLPLVAGSWQVGGSGCLVANVVTSLASRGGAAAAPPAGDDTGAVGDADTTLDIRILDLMPEMSSRDLNRMIVAWDTAADQDGAVGDAELRGLLRGALVRAGVVAPPTGHAHAGLLSGSSTGPR